MDTLLTANGEAVLFDPRNRVLKTSGVSSADILRCLVEVKDRSEVVFAGHGTGFTLVSAGGSRFHIVDESGLPLLAGDDGALSPKGPRSGTALPCLIVSEKAISTLRQISGGDWVARSSRQSIRASEIRMERGPVLRLPGGSVDLEHDLPSALREEPAGAPAEVSLFLDGWNPETLIAYRPLVVYVAFGPDEKIFERLELSLRSLREIGSYGCDILVIGRLEKSRLIEMMPGYDPDLLHTMRAEGSNGIDYCAARYRVIEWDGARRHQPILYMDTDVVVDQEIRPSLEECLFNERIAAQAEEFSLLDRSAAAGSFLFAEAGMDVEGQAGFNAGILAIPNLRDHEPTLRLILQTIYRVKERFGRESLRFADQPVANYVSHRLAPFDLRTLTERVRYTRKGDMCGGASPIGFVHFWGSGGRCTREMRRYVRGLAGERRRRVAAARSRDEGRGPEQEPSDPARVPD